MNDTILDQNDEEVAVSEITDEVLEKAGAPGGQPNFTLGACTGLSACPA